MYNNDVKSVRDTLNELILLHELNKELFEALGIATKRLVEYVNENDIPLNESLVVSLQRAIMIYDELLISKNITKSLKLPASFFDDRDPEELPEPR